MIVRQTIVKAFIAFIIIVGGVVFWEKTHINSPQATSITMSPTPTVTIFKQSGWTLSREKEVLDACPLKALNPGLCTCALQKAEAQYSYVEVQNMYASYQKTKTIDPNLQKLLQSCT